MNRLKWGVGLAVAAIVSVFSIGAVANAQRFSTDTDADEIIRSSLYSAGQSVSIKGEIFGDVFCAGRSVDVNATVHGDVICAGQDVTIAGTVNGDIRVAGQNVSISAKTTDGVTVAASEFSLDAPASIGRDLTAVGNSLNIKGTVGRDATLNGTEVILNGPVARNVDFTGTKLEMKSGAKVSGGLYYESRNEVKKADGATVAGRTERRQPAKDGNSVGFNFAWYVLALVALSLFALAIALIAPRTLHSLSETIGTVWVKPMLIGLAASLVLPFAAVMLIITMVGVPLGLAVLLVWLALMLFSGPVAAYYLGRRILGKQPNVLLRILVGSAILITACFLPFIGFFVMLAAYWTGSGAILLAAKRRLGKPNYVVE